MELTTAAWVVVASASVASCFLSLVLGALRSYSHARFEALLEGQPERLEQMGELLADELRLGLTLAGLRGLAIVAGAIALTGASIFAAFEEGLPGTGTPRDWVLVGLEAWLIGVALFVLLGNMIPVAIGQRRAEGTLLRLLPLLRWILRAAAPLGWVLLGLTSLALRLFGLGQPEKDEELVDDLLSAAMAGQSEGLIDPAAVAVIENLIGFQETAVSEVMTPRMDMQTVDADDDRETLLRKALESMRSRLPVVEGSVDKVVGVLIVKDLLRAQAEPGLDPRSLFRPPMFVPETKRVADLLREFRRDQVHLAIVADEFGGTAGVVTIEDVIEELIGDIHDEKDRRAIPIMRLSPTEVDVDARLHIDEVNQALGTRIPEDHDVETLGGFLALRLGKIPGRGDKVALPGASFVVTEADDRRPRRVRVKLGVGRGAA